MRRITPGRDGDPDRDGRNRRVGMADAEGDQEEVHAEEQHARALQRRYLIRF
jgi:hypothetical protein